MQTTVLNRVDLSQIPESIQTDLCSGAIALVMRHRNDPGRRERFEKWLKEQQGNKTA